jgi:hypothetical protein
MDTLTPPMTQPSEDGGSTMDGFSQEDSLSPSTPLSSSSSIFCSVLNVCIDQTMENPTQFESDELKPTDSKTTKETERASISSQNIQVPVIRVFGSILPGNTRQAPTQSACLYIHGAYPYLLARPVAAGPDGSLIGGALSSSGNNQSNQHIDWDDAKAVRRCLRHFTETLEEALQNLELHGPNENPMTDSNNAKSSTRFIRRITVVEGRGFYTYCPGPPAPFLRVEYYDPKVRWKVKLQLEKGLEVPDFYHPDPAQYNYRLDTAPTSNRGDREDMDEPLKFHCYEAHIPYTMQFFKDYNLAGMSYIHVAKALVRGSSTSSAASNQLQQAGQTLQYWDSHISSQKANEEEESERFEVPKRQTSCGIELDCHVNDILNVESVITSLPSDQEAADEIQWRAVPSLQEIWKQERLRMSKLLPVEQNFLSVVPSDSTPPFTLNVKKGASRPGARLACEGMWSLVNVTSGLSREFKRSLCQIVQRHQRAVSDVDNLITARRKENGREEISEEIQMTPTVDETMAALGALGDQFGDDGVQETPSNSQIPLSYPSSQKLKEDTCHDDSQVDVEVYTRRLERGDSVFEDSEREVEDFIDPETLLPYDELYFADDCCRVLFRVDTDAPGTKRVCGVSARVCTREGHSDINSPRANPGYFKTISMGTYVDGIMTVDDTSDDEDSGDEDDKERFEQTLTMLASQHPADEDTGNSWRGLHIEENTQSNDIGVPSSQFHHTQPFALGQESEDEDDSDGESDNETSNVESSLAVDAERKETTVNAFSENRTQWDGICQGVLSPASMPPNRSDITKLGDTVRLYGLQNVETPSWVNHVAAYKYKPDEEGDRQRWFPKIGKDGNYFRPIKGPPDRSKVASWLKKNGSDVDVEPRTKRKANTVSNMEIDGNSRKFVPSKKKKIQFEISVDRVFGEQRIEEVAWDLSQPLSLSASQLTQEEEPSTSRPGTQNMLEEGQSTTSPVGHQTDSQPSEEALEGIGAQGGRIHIQGGGGLKAKTRPSQGFTQTKGVSDQEMPSFLPCPISFMVIETHVQCRTGESRLDSRKIAMVPNSSKDKIFAVSYLVGKDPSGGEPLKIEERGCIYVPLQSEESSSREELVRKIRSSMPKFSFGVTAPLSVECVKDEKNLLLRIASVVRRKDPDMLLSWDTQNSGLGYLIERGAVIGEQASKNDTTENKGAGVSSGIDMVRLLGRTPHDKKQSHFLLQTAAILDFDKATEEDTRQPEGKVQFRGSGLGADWDEKVGAGAAAASIVSS